jgi:hypothetical protein
MPILGIQKLTVSAASACKSKDAVFEIEVINEALLAKALGNLLGLLMFGFKGVNQVQANKVGHFDLDRHGAAVGSARVAHTGLVARPTFNAVYVDDASWRSHNFLTLKVKQFAVALLLLL